MGYKAAVQILKEADDLKGKVLKKCDLITDSQVWTDQQKLQSVYHQVLLLDLEYALDKKVEQDLWNIGFKNHISVLQEMARDKRNSRRSEAQALLTWCLEAASGFYLTLLHELCNAFDIDLPFRRRGNVYGQSNLITDINLPQSSSCLYICQYCLVHLGDIARYRNQRKQAENFYKQAILVSSSSGHPYNQLALLEASQGDKLSTVFYYIRGIAVKNPFPASTTNLLSTLNSAIDKENPIEKIQTKITVNEFIQVFLATHALLHTATDLNQAEFGVKSLNATMTALVATQSFTTDKLIKITAINLYALKHVMNSSELTEDEKRVRQYVLELLAGSLSAFLVPVHTLKNDETLLDYYALPAVRILTYWIKNEPDTLKEEVFANRLQIWPSLCKLLTNVQLYLQNFDHLNYETTPLHEDKILQGFRPILRNLKELNFKSEEVEDKTEKLIRIKKLVDFGIFVAQQDVNNTKLVTQTQDGDKIHFEPGCIQPDPTNDLLEEMKSFNVTESSPKGGLGPEKKGGILKPQGSLEKSREERELFSSGEASLISSDLSNTSSSSSSESKKEAAKKRTKQNVALQSIFKKLEENKQVKFNVDDVSKEKEKSVSFDAKAAAGPQFNTSLRTQSFNQNHPAFPIQSNQQDYLNTLRNVTKPPSSQPSFVFPNTEVPPPNIKNIPPPMVYPTSQPPLFGTNLNSIPNYTASRPPPPPNAFNAPPPPIHSRIVPPYQTVQFPPEPTGPPPASPWWPTSSSQQQNFQNYPFNVPFGLPDFGKNQNNQAGGDVFNSPWNNFDRNSFVNRYDSQSMSTRQAMLKETTGKSNQDFMQHQSNSPGYSLFNTNNWGPNNLVGQLKNSKPLDNSIPQMHQHSLFTGQGPQSLAQLLEQQQSQKKEFN